MLAELQQAEHRGIRDLTRNPLLLTLLCLTYEETLSFPARRVEIYEEALGALLKKWDASRGIRRRSLYGRLSPGRKEQMFARIAYDASIRGDILFARRDLEGWIKAYLVHVPEMPDAVDIDGEAVLREIVAQHGIFAEQARDLFSFAHLTFQEYYTARYIWEHADDETLETLIARMDDDEWREIFLLTASRLPDATRFLQLFETALRDRVARRPRLVAWLRWIDARAAESTAGYRRPATRLYLALTLALDFAFARDRALDLNLALSFALAPALDLDLARDLARDLDLDFARDLGLALVSAFVRARDVEKVTERWPDRRRHLEQDDLYQALAALPVPAEDAPPEAWQALADRLQATLKRHDALRRYRQLEAETQSLSAEQQKWWWAFDGKDFKTLFTYLRGTRLFYDCLQLAYTPDRAGFEERIFAPPP